MGIVPASAVARRVNTVRSIYQTEIGAVALGRVPLEVNRSVNDVKEPLLAPDVHGILWLSLAIAMGECGMFLNNLVSPIRRRCSFAASNSIHCLARNGTDVPDFRPDPAGESCTSGNERILKRRRRIFHVNKEVQAGRDRGSAETD